MLEAAVSVKPGPYKGAKNSATWLVEQQLPCFAITVAGKVSASHRRSPAQSCRSSVRASQVFLCLRPCKGDARSSRQCWTPWIHGNFTTFWVSCIFSRWAGKCFLKSHFHIYFCGMWNVTCTFIYMQELCNFLNRNNFPEITFLMSKADSDQGYAGHNFAEIDLISSWLKLHPLDSQQIWTPTPRR